MSTVSRWGSAALPAAPSPCEIETNWAATEHGQQGGLSSGWRQFCSQADFSKEPKFVEAAAKSVYYEASSPLTVSKRRPAGTAPTRP
jgi:hypothetical protein